MYILLHCVFLFFSDALLADLQNTVSPGSGGIGGGSSPGYGSLNKTSRQSPGSETPSSRVDAYSTKSVSKTEYILLLLFFYNFRNFEDIIFLLYIHCIEDKDNHEVVIFL